MSSCRPVTRRSALTQLVLAALSVLLVLAPVSGARAHPHVFVEARSRLIVDDQGMARSLEHVFRFDDAYSAFALQGFDANEDGQYSRDELAELAKVNIDSMAEFGYFTFGDNSRVELDFKAPTSNYWLEVVDVPIGDYWALSPDDLTAMREDAAKYGSPVLETVQLLELHFTLDLKDPSDLSQPLTLDVYDPTYYVDFRFSRAADALGVVNGPATCAVERRDPPSLDSATQMALAQIGADQRDLPPELQEAAASQVNQMVVTCPGAPEIATAASTAEGTAVSSLAEDEGQEAIRSALRPGETTPMAQLNDSAPAQGAATSETAAVTAERPAAVSPGLGDRVFGTLAQVQAEFYQKLIASLRAFRNEPHAAWWLAFISFAYGIFHAAGPGHGKAVISSYVIANNETLRKGILLSFLSAFAQAVTAVVLVGGLAAIFNLTSLAIQDTARWLEIGSYALVTALGAWLLWHKGLSRLFGRTTAHGHHHHAHGHDDHDHGHHHHHGHSHAHTHGEGEVCATCGHAHAPTPDMVQGRMSLRRMISIILAVGLRPCSGALIVLVFAFGQGMVLAGIGSSFAMALGTGLTVSALAALAVFAREGALRLFGAGSVAAGRALMVLEIAGALVVLLIGLMLLIATLGWG